MSSLSPWQRLISRASTSAAIIAITLFGLGDPSRSAPWRDDFAGVPVTLPDGSVKSYPDPQRWAFTFRPGIQWPDSFGDGTNWLESNGECQVYLSPFADKGSGSDVDIANRYDPFLIEADGLHIRAAPLSPKQIGAYGLKPSRLFGSGLLVSKEAFKYGRFTLRARLPAARGAWPAFWLLAADGKWPPEIDVLEGMPWGKRARQIHAGIIARTEEKKTYGDWFDLAIDPSEAFHDYVLDWTEKTITIRVDDKVLLRRETPVSMQQPMYLLINLAVGGRWPYNELGIPPIEGMDETRLLAGARLIQNDYPADFIIRSISVEAE